MEVNDFTWAKKSPGEKAPSRLRPFLTRMIIVLGVFLAAQIVFIFLVAPGLKISRITVTGARDLGDAKVLALAGLAKGMSYLQADTAKAKKNLESSGLIRKAEVVLIFPDTIKIEVERRIAVAAVAAPSQDGPGYLTLDQDGVLCGPVPGAEIPDVIVLSGLEFRGRTLGGQLPGVLVPLLGEIGALKTGSEALYRWIGEIRINRTRENSYSLTVYPSKAPFKILLANRLEPRLLKEAAVLADLLKKNSMETEVQELDFRTEQIVLKTVEG